MVFGFELEVVVKAVEDDVQREDDPDEITAPKSEPVINEVHSFKKMAGFVVKIILAVPDLGEYKNECSEKLECRHDHL